MPKVFPAPRSVPHEKLRKVSDFAFFFKVLKNRKRVKSLPTFNVNVFRMICISKVIKSYKVTVLLFCSFLFLFKVGAFRFIIKRFEFIRCLREKSGDFYQIYILQEHLKKVRSRETSQSGVRYPTVTGELKIVSENPYCASCTGIIQQFHDMYPNIKLILIDGAK